MYRLKLYKCLEYVDQILHAITSSSLEDETRRTLTLSGDAAVAEAVSRWLPTAAARVRTRVWSSGICVGQSGAEVGFLWVLRPISGRRDEWIQYGIQPPPITQIYLFF
jgi:hypothetical protein